MRRFALASLVACVFVTLWGVVSAEKVCYFSQEPDASQSGRLRWVMPGSKEDRCACNSTRPGSVNVQAVRRPHPPFYTDTPIFTNDQEDIHDYFGCHDPCQPNPCRYNGKCEKHGDSFNCDCEGNIRGKRCDKPYDCNAVDNAIKIRESGVYTIYPSQYPQGLQVICDSSGWIVFQKRFDGSVNFTRNWTEYRDGFGDLSGEFWLGNEKLRQLTSAGQWVLEIAAEVHSDEFTYRWPFRVEGDSYKLVVEGFTDGLPFLSIETPHAFSTYDRDNDDVNRTNCAEVEGGGWWFGQCGSPQDFWGNLNGEYSLLGDPDNYTDREYGGMKWNVTGDVIVVRSSQMKLRRFTPRDCQHLYDFGIEGSGVYTIYPRRYTNIDRMKVYCDMDTEPNGWIVFQDRFEGLVNFTRNWTEYQDGFGELSGEFWLGNEKLRRLTTGEQWALEIELFGPENITYYRWLSFRVMGNSYDLEVQGSIDDFHLPSSETPLSFSTYDKDNDDVNGTNCAKVEGGGWWFGQCEFVNDSWVNLNGEFSLLGDPYDLSYQEYGIMWDDGEKLLVQSSRMKLRRFSPRDCLELYDFGIRASGIYTIYLKQTSVRVYCDMEANGGGWTVFQKRFDESVDFTRNWAEYRDGFGELSGEFWLGNEKLRQLTSTKRWKLRVDLEDDQGMTRQINVNKFSVKGSDYELDRAATDFDFPKRKFSTHDKDNDGEQNSNCAAEQKGGWWFGVCSDNILYSLNGEYHRVADYLGTKWAGWGTNGTFKCEMKLRRY